MNLATGSFIAFVDGDDWVHPEFVAFLMEQLRRADADVAVSGFGCDPEEVRTADPGAWPVAVFLRAGGPLPRLRSTPLVREDLSLMRALASRMREPARRLMATRQPLAYRILLGAVLVSARLADVSYWAVARRVGGGS